MDDGQEPDDGAIALEPEPDAATGIAPVVEAETSTGIGTEGANEMPKKAATKKRQIAKVVRGRAPSDKRSAVVQQRRAAKQQVGDDLKANSRGRYILGLSESAATVLAAVLAKAVKAEDLAADDLDVARGLLVRLNARIAK